jgi:hypothetical protein
MKKNISTLITSFILLFAMTFAKASDGKIPESVKTEFGRQFYFANNVKWENTEGYYEASFNASNRTLFAFYTGDADFMGIAVNILSSELPASLQSKLKTENKDFWITGLFKVVLDNKTTYYAELQNGDQTVMLKSNGNADWSFYRKIKND